MKRAVAPQARIGLLFAVLLLTGCAATFDHQLEFDPADPIRVAVLPFYQVDDEGAVMESSPNLFFVDNLPGVSAKLEEPAAVIVQKLVQNELGGTALDIVSPWHVRAELVQRQFTLKREYDFMRIEEAAPSELCELFSCDALLFGRLTKWDRSYYGLQSVASVAFELRLVNADDGRELYTITASDSESRGLTKGPTGYTSLVLEPLKGLSNELITELASRMARQALAPLRLENRPDFAGTPAPAIFGSTHDAPDGVLDAGSKLTVMLAGSHGQSASFSIGDYVTDVPMYEVFPGHYLGEFHPLNEDRFDALDVFVSLSDRFNRSTSQRIGVSKVSLR